MQNKKSQIWITSIVFAILMVIVAITGNFIIKAVNEASAGFSDQQKLGLYIGLAAAFIGILIAVMAYAFSIRRILKGNQQRQYENNRMVSNLADGSQLTVDTKQQGPNLHISISSDSPKQIAIGAIAVMVAGSGFCALLYYFSRNTFILIFWVLLMVVGIALIIRQLTRMKNS
ncbi:MAG: hypothetical protein LBR25_10340 [Erysipelotrichaceae bacterium]|jgi:membrane protein implicated in regulation of membrane protease activity|nr:hypothetical protein [Erysipelotrichaceae bacterium]